MARLPLALALFGAARGKSAAEDVAQRHGLRYRARGDKDFVGRYRDLRQVPRGASIRSIFEGDLDGRALTAFQVTYQVYTGQGTFPVSHTVYATDAPSWPHTLVRPRGWMGRLARRLGRRSGLELESAEFNLYFKVTTGDEGFAIALMSPAMQAFMLVKTNVRWRIDPGRVCLIYGGALKLDRMDASLERLRRFWALVTPELEAW